jgi:sigma-B regulation protein RsbU (phosphoserine phosphatase)
MGSDLFSDGEQKLVTAVAGQIASAIENARLVERDMARERIAHELELAHDLQLKLLPDPAVLGDDVDLAARCLPAESIGGDFYHFLRLPNRRVGVMLGDVSSHGFAAALIMALVLSAAGIHADASDSVELTVRRILESVQNELEETEMHLSLFYAVIDLEKDTMEYANAGHPHAFRLQPDGARERLGATAPPLGLAGAHSIHSARTSWQSCCDRLVLFSDGVSDAQNAQGERFGEDRVLDVVARHADEPSEDVLEEVLREFDAFGADPHDDRTLLVLRT